MTKVTLGLQNHWRMANGGGWHYAAGFNIGGNPFQFFTWQKAGLAL